MTIEELDKLDTCRFLLPDPGPDVVGGLIKELRRAREVIEAARCIRHWHDSGDDGFVVSKEHVIKLWESLHKFDGN